MKNIPAALTGLLLVSPLAKGVAQPELLWTRELGSPISAAPAELPDGRIVVATTGIPNPDTSRPNLNARLTVFLPSGAQDWSRVPFGGIASTPAVGADGAVYTATLGTHQQGGRVEAFNPDGSFRWSKAEERSFTAAVTLAPDARSFLLNSFAGLIARSPAGDRLWSLELGSATEVTQAGDRTLLLGFVGGGGANFELWRITPDGIVIHRHPVPGFTSAPVIAPDGTIIFGSVGATRSQNALRALNPDGSLRWVAPLPAAPAGDPVISADGTVHVADQAGMVRAYDAAGQLLWTGSAGAAVHATPAVDGQGTVWLVTLDGRLCGVASGGGDVRTLTLGGELRAAPLIAADGTLYVGGLDGRLHAVLGAVPVIPGGAPMYRRNARRTGSAGDGTPPAAPEGLAAAVEASGHHVTLSWAAPPTPVTYEVVRSTTPDRADAIVLGRYVSGRTWTDSTAVAGVEYHYWIRAQNAYGPGPWGGPVTARRPAVVAGSVTWFRPLAGARGAVALRPGGETALCAGSSDVALLAADGTPLWRRSFADPIQSQESLLLTAPPVILPSGRIAVAGSVAFRARGPLMLLDAGGSTNEVVDQFPAGRLPAVAGEDDALVLPSVGGLRWRKADGTELWAHFGSGISGHPAVRADGAVFGPPHALVNPAGGLTLSPAPRMNPSTGAALGDDGTAYFGFADPSADAGGVVAVGTDGSVRWTVDTGTRQLAEPVIAADGSVVFGTRAGELWRCSPADGSILSRFPVGEPVEAAAAVAADGTIYCPTTRGRLLAFTAEGALRWQLTLGTNAVSAPAIRGDGQVLVTLEDVGVFAVAGGSGPAASAWPMLRHDAARSARGRMRATPVPQVTGLLAAEPDTARGAVTLTWSPAAWAESYEVWRGLTGDTNGMALLHSNVVGAVSFRDATAAPGQVYVYRVRGRNWLGSGEASEVAAGGQHFRRWNFPTGGTEFGGLAEGLDGTLRFLGGALGRSHLIALNAAGYELWRHGPFQVAGGLVLDEENNAYFMINGRAVASVDASGTRRWQTELVSSGAPFVAVSRQLALTGDGVILACLRDGAVVALDRHGSVLFRGDARCGADAAPVVLADGSFLTPEGIGGLRQFARNGVRLRTHPAVPPVRLAALPDGGFLTFERGTLTARSDNGLTNFTFGLPPGTDGAPVAGPAGVIFLATTRGLHALETDGSVRWSLTNLNLVTAPVVLADGSLVVRSRSQLIALGQTDGRELWRAETGAITGVFEPDLGPVPMSGGPLICVSGTNMVAFSSGAGAWPSGWPAYRGDVRRTASLGGRAPAPSGPLQTVAATQGTLVEKIRFTWATNTDFAEVELWGGFTTSLSEARRLAAVPPGVFHLTLAAAPAGPGHFWLRSTNASGAGDWTGPVQGSAAAGVATLWRFRGPTNLSAPCLSPQDRFHVTATDGSLLAIKADGTAVWTNRLLTPPLSHPAAAGDGTVIVVEASGLAAVSPDGNVLWRTAVGTTGSGAFAVLPDGGVALTDAGQVLVFNSVGTTRWAADTADFSIRHAAVSAEGHVLVGGAGGYFRFQPDGTLLPPWPTSGGAEGGFAVLPDGRIYGSGFGRSLFIREPEGSERGLPVGAANLGREPVVGSDHTGFTFAQGNVVEAMSPDGSLRWSRSARSAWLAALADGGVLLASTNGLAALDAGGNTRWLWESDGAALSAPLITADGRVAFSVRNELVVLVSPVRPAATGWAMWRADPQRSGRTATTARWTVWRRGDQGWTARAWVPASEIWRLEYSGDFVTWNTVGEVTGTGTGQDVPIPPLPAGEHGFLRLRRP